MSLKRPEIRLKLEEVAASIGLRQETVSRVLRAFEKEGYQIYATSGTWRTFRRAGIRCEKIRKQEEPGPNITDLVLEHQLDVIIDVPEEGLKASHDGFRIRRLAVETGVYVISAVDTALALAEALAGREEEPSLVDIASL